MENHELESNAKNRTAYFPVDGFLDGKKGLSEKKKVSISHRFVEYNYHAIRTGLQRMIWQPIKDLLEWDMTCYNDVTTSRVKLFKMVLCQVEELLW